MESVANRNERPLGAFLVIASALVFSLSGVLTKAITADAWTIVCWRGLIGGLLIAAYVALSGRDKPPGDSFRLGWRGWLLASVGSLASLAFIFAFKMTYVANVAVIYATAPFMAAGLGWWLIREGLRSRTLIAATFSLLGIIIIVAGGLGTGNIIGDAVALAMTFGNAPYMVLIRVFRGTSVVWAGAFQRFSYSP
jgi:drug/metabolite transporter (DMT)-like permease